MEQWPPGVDGRGRFVGMGRDRSKGSDLLGVLRKRFVTGCNSTTSVSIKAMVFKREKERSQSQEISLFFTTINNASPMLCERNARQLAIHSGNALL